jgi:hypothetical protein
MLIALEASIIEGAKNTTKMAAKTVYSKLNFGYHNKVKRNLKQVPYFFFYFDHRLHQRFG